ncbi:MAG TPA: adenylate/guanylate cyclase domain-containing protein [Gaiellaceae bacterium]
MQCAACGSENEAGRKFCGECGNALSLPCPACGGSNTPGVKFCGECGARLESLPARAPAEREAPASERRLVSVLFADLVGFTALSESRDAEETRELLSRYFDTCRRLIELYGGTVEKFIGDAVMAVWGTPIATEDDAERAVRAALDLVAAVTALGDEIGAPDLRARAGVLTGEAAVTVGAEGEGMVAGDLVNTASRIQSIADPGCVLVGEATRRTTDQTIVYADAGSHELKGKDGLVPLWQALRVIAGARGSLKSTGLEAPFVGRDGELRRIKDLFHTCADDRKPQLISITGIAGIGKSRLAWEFYKYFDGLPQITYWHRGRCLSYGEGVTYWALADMVRMRARIAEDEEPASALAKLAQVVEEHLPDTDERRFVEPRLRHLLGLEDSTRFEREDLFAAWRLFVERLADVYPTVMVFEDMQWADASLLDFIEYLLEWSRSSPLFVVTLARPELQDRRPTWGAASRNFTSIYLEPLPEPAMEELLAGLVPGLPEALRHQILERAEGIPLYAVETVRMLLDRGALVQEGSVYRLTGTVEALEVPETLHALIAARLDGLTAEERRVMQDGAVLGKTFTKQALAAVSGFAEQELDPLLASLTRKELLGVQADPRTPEHGQYGFLQDLLRRVAYETLAKSDRKSRHLAAAGYLEEAWGDHEVVEVVASHYLNAYEAAPATSDAAEIRDKARAALTRAGERAASLGASEEAQRYFEQSSGLTDEPLVQAALLDRAGQMANNAGANEAAARLFETSIGLYEAQGETHAMARASARLGEVESRYGQLEKAIERMERAYAVISTDEPDEDLGLLAARLALSYWFAGNTKRAAEHVELALEIGESLSLPEVLERAWTTKAMLTTAQGRPEEARGLFKLALEHSLEHGLTQRAANACGNLSDISFQRDRYEEALGYLHQALAIARKDGDRPNEWFSISETTYALYMTGHWDEAIAALAEIPEERLPTGGTLISPLTSVLEIHLHRGNLDEARRIFSIYARLAESGDVQDQSCYACAEAALGRAEGRFPEALVAAERALSHSATVGVANQGVKQALAHGIEAALAIGDREKAEGFLATIESLPPGRRPPFLDGQAHRFRARLAPTESAADSDYAAAATRFRELELPFWLAVTLLEHGEWLGEQGRSNEAEPLLAEARGIFEQLGATPWLERAGAPVAVEVGV